MVGVVRSAALVVVSVGLVAACGDESVPIRDATVYTDPPAIVLWVDACLLMDPGRVEIAESAPDALSVRAVGKDHDEDCGSSVVGMLDEPLGSRTLIDAHTKEPIPVGLVEGPPPFRVEDSDD